VATAPEFSVTTPESTRSWFAVDANAVVAAMGSDVERGLGVQEAAARLARIGPNQIARDKPPSAWAIALGQLRDPMNIMLVAVTVVSLVISQFPPQ
jgi:Ca2+-transporting ATPase